ncbi:hypothetical protein AB0D62_35275 [Streptomyces massasporeus]|uniref:hypothetical protein n=1 Tax=Streptomyces massasporeus TaxID=67324 RepID=UPI0033D1FAB2
MSTWTRRRLLTSAATALPTAGLAVTAASPARAAAPATTRPGDADVAQTLRALPGLRLIEERHDAEPGYRHFVLGLRRPVDHTDPAVGTFEQRLTLLHTAADRPTVLFSTGYQAILTPRRSEPAVLLGANQLQVEHRHFGTSRPADPGYTHLTVRQAADVYHRVAAVRQRRSRPRRRGALPPRGPGLTGAVGAGREPRHRPRGPSPADRTWAQEALARWAGQGQVTRAARGLPSQRPGRPCTGRRGAW